MTIDVDLDLPAKDAESAEPVERPARRRVWLTVAIVSLWLVIGLVALPLLAFGLERTGAIFGSWGDWREWWARDMWVLAIGTALLYLSVVAGLSLALVGRRWISAAAFSLVLIAAITAYSAVYEAHPERFADVMAVVKSVTGAPAPDQPAG